MRDGGKLTLCALENIAEDGFMPQEALVDKAEAFFSFRDVGVTRLYAALGANHRIDLLVRAWVTDLDPEWQYVVLNDEQYRIDVSQTVGDAVDLTLIRLEEKYDRFAE